MPVRPLLLALVAALALAGCLGGGEESDPQTDPTATPPPAAQNATARAVSVDLVDRQVPPGVGVPPQTMGVSPATLELKVGERVDLTVTNRGSSGHDLVIDGLDVATETLAPGASVNVEFTPLEAGTYKMYCSLGGSGPTGHEGQGMVGEVVVS